MISNVAQLHCKLYIVFLLARKMSLLLFQQIRKQTEDVLPATLRSKPDNYYPLFIKSNYLLVTKSENAWNNELLSLHDFPSFIVVLIKQNFFYYI